MALLEWSWSRDDLLFGLTHLSRKTGLLAAGADESDARRQIAQPDLGPFEFIRWQADVLGIRAEPVQASYAQLRAMLSNAPPAVLRIMIDGLERFLLLADMRSEQAVVLGPDLASHLIDYAILAEMMIAPIVASMPTDVTALLQAARIPRRRMRAAREAMLSTCLRDINLDGCWLLRTPAIGAWKRDVRRQRFGRRIFGLLTAHAGQIAIGLLAWTFVGKMTFTSDQSPSWIWALLLALLTLVPFQLLSQWIAGVIALDFGAELKQHLLVGALNMPIEYVKSGGIGQHLSRVIESEVFERLLLAGAANAVTACLQLGAAIIILALNDELPQSILLLIWLGFLTLIFIKYLRTRSVWTANRLMLTNELVENLIGHQTRLAQEDEMGWHRRDDEALSAYQLTGRKMDHWQLTLQVLASRGWLPLGLIGLIPSFLGHQEGEIGLAVGLGATLLAQQAITQLAGSGRALGDAAIAWRAVKPMFKSADVPSEMPGTLRARDLLARAQMSDACEAPTLIDVQNLSLGYDSRAKPILKDVNCTVRDGDKILLQGESGGGKSTFAAVLAGLKAPASGLVFLRGLDRGTLGAAEWRKHVVLAPQFHDNHILTGTLAFNLLMGGRWPPKAEDLEDAEAICRKLELGPLLDRMPNGIQQAVGETGWQLSHGERSRVFLARALLQRTDMLILDESVAALDPEKLHLCLGILLEQQRTMVLIAHP